MQRRHWRALAPLLLVAGTTGRAAAQQALTWEQVRERFLSNNPNLGASRVNIEEVRANEISAGLRPNPEFSVVLDQFHIFNPPVDPFNNSQWTPTVQQLFERRHKRQLRVASAQEATSIATTDADDVRRTLTFNLRDAFNRILLSKSLLDLAQENMQYYDEVIRLNRERLKAGDISQSDFDRLDLQRVQFESDLVNARVNQRTAKIDLLQFLNDRQPVDSFDVAGDFGFKETIVLPQELHEQALESRPDLRSATRAVEKAQVDNRLAWANGSTDPTLGFEYQRTGPDHTAGLLFTIPIRVFDRNQGEKARTALDIQRTQRVREGLMAAILHDVDAAYAQVDSTRSLLRPYRDRYLPQAEKVRETVSFAYQNGGASLLDFLDAQKSYRDVQLAYRNLIGSYLTAVNQLNLAVGREVFP
jgi:outer membrane protein, heavy metal efflux system